MPNVCSSSPTAGRWRPTPSLSRPGPAPAGSSSQELTRCTLSGGGGAVLRGVQSRGTDRAEPRREGAPGTTIIKYSASARHHPLAAESNRASSCWMQLFIRAPSLFPLPPATHRRRGTGSGASPPARSATAPPPSSAISPSWSSAAATAPWRRPATYHDMRRACTWCTALTTSRPARCDVGVGRHQGVMPGWAGIKV